MHAWKSGSHQRRAGGGRRARIVIAGVGLSIAGQAAAADRSWTAGDGTWGTAGNWTPVGVPTAFDNAFIGNLPGVSDSWVTMTSPVTVAALAITDGMVLDNDHRSLTVNGTLAIAGTYAVPAGGTHPSRLSVSTVDGLSVNAGNLLITDGAALNVWSGSYVRVNGLLDVDASSRISGEGGYLLYGNGAKAYDNDGALSLQPGLTTISQFGTGLIDLDGTAGNGKVNILISTIETGETGSLRITGSQLADAFDGEMNFVTGAAVEMNLDAGWALGTGGVILIYDATYTQGPVVVRGSPWSIAGTILGPSADAGLRVEADATFEPTAQLTLGEGYGARFTGQTDIEGGTFDFEDAPLRFTGPTTISGGDFTLAGPPLVAYVGFEGATEWRGTVTIDGTARQQGPASVTGATSITAQTFDMDGPGDASWTIGNTLVVNADYLEFGNGTRFDGSMAIAGGFFGRLTMNLTNSAWWTMAGQMTLTGEAALYTTRVAGSGMIVSGGLSVASGRPQISAPTQIADSATVTVPAGAILSLTGSTRVEALATFAGEGTVRNGSTGTLHLEDGASLDQLALLNNGTFELFSDAGSAATAAVGRFENASNGTLSVNVLGPVAGSEHDLLLVSGGPATLAGALWVRHNDPTHSPFRPDVGDEFTILTALDGVTGAFAAAPRSFSQGLAIDWTVDYGPNDVTLRVLGSAECPLGDLDEDGDIDISDLAILLAGFGTPSGAHWGLGDIDGDGDVDLQDMATLLGNFGSTCV